MRREHRRAALHANRGAEQQPRVVDDQHLIEGSAEGNLFQELCQRNLDAQLSGLIVQCEGTDDFDLAVARIELEGCALSAFGPRQRGAVIRSDELRQCLTLEERAREARVCEQMLGVDARGFEQALHCLRSILEAAQIVAADVLDLAEHVGRINARRHEDEREQAPQAPQSATGSIVLDLGIAGGGLGHG
jgi:hypothetical protein